MDTLILIIACVAAWMLFSAVVVVAACMFSSQENQKQARLRMATGRDDYLPAEDLTSDISYMKRGRDE